MSDYTGLGAWFYKTAPHLLSAAHASATNLGILTTPPFKFDISLKVFTEPSKDTWLTFSVLLWRLHLENSQMEETYRARDGGGPSLKQHKYVFHTSPKSYCSNVCIVLIFSSPLFLGGQWWGWRFPPLTFWSFWRSAPSWGYQEMLPGGSATLLAKTSISPSVLESSLLWINNRLSYRLGNSKIFRNFVAETRNKEYIYFSNFHRRNIRHLTG